MNRIGKALLVAGICAGVALGTPSNALAKKQEDTANEAVLPIQYKTIESAGLYHSLRQGGLGKDLWHGATRSILSDLLRYAPTQSTSRVLNVLNKKLLLSAANSALLNDDITIKAGEDLLTLRLNRLLDMGIYKETFEQYSLLNNEPYHDNLARAGILSMLYNGERSLACLEANTIKDRFKEVSFWVDFVAYCNNTLSEKSDKKSTKILKNSKLKILYKASTKKKYRFTYSAEEFEALSRLEQGILISGNALSFKNMKASDISNIPVRHVLLLLQHNKLPKSYKTLLTIRAVKLGLLEPPALASLYEENKKAYQRKNKDENTDDVEASPSIESTLKTWQKPSFFYATINKTKGNTERWNILRKALALKDTLGVAALSPFASIISKTTPENATLQEINTAVRIMHMAGVSFPKKWANYLQKTENNKTAHSKNYKNLTFALFIAKPRYKRKPTERAEVKEFLDTKPNKNTAFSRIVIENIDKNIESVNNTSKVYDKAYHLTGMFNYVMPNIDVMDRLALSSKNRSVSETILLCASILRNTETQTLYPGVSREIISSLSSVGLINVSKDLAIEAILAGQ